MRLIIRAYTAVAVISALVGTLAYLGLMPKADLFVLYGRAKALFKDPNVFAPFLVLPAMFALQRIFLGNLRQVIVGGLVFGILFVGVFVSFSRAGWGYLALSSLLTFALVFVLEATARDKLRMLIMAFVGVAVLATVLVGLLSIPEVSRLFEQRASLSQSYDTGETGRFGRQAYAFELALQNPLGIGPLEFRNLRIVEEPHNTYVNVLHAYGWGGGASLIALIVMTLWRGLNALTRAGPQRLLLVPVMATYIPLVLQAAIIDVDHWRHFYLLAGLVWGLSAAAPQRSAPLPRSRALI
jgi:O-antigen ligase